MNNYTLLLSIMPKDSLAVELDQQRANKMHFEAADRSYRDPAEIERREETEAKLKLIHAEMKTRREKERLALLKLGGSL